MIGTKVTVRLRMGAHDAHYAGELVDGARMLALFGDVATELLIRIDGDEGLFRAYETVDFLAPVFSGDFIEATGELIKMGNTSRQIRFEARKVIANVRERGMAPSAADVLPDPIIVCRAVGTCVTPKDMQRKPRGLYMTALPVHTPTGPGPIVTPASEGGGPRTLPTTEKHEPDVILTAHAAVMDFAFSGRLVRLFQRIALTLLRASLWLSPIAGFLMEHGCRRLRKSFTSHSFSRWGLNPLGAHTARRTKVRLRGPECERTQNHLAKTGLQVANSGSFQCAIVKSRRKRTISGSPS